MDACVDRCLDNYDCIVVEIMNLQNYRYASLVLTNQSPQADYSWTTGRVLAAGTYIVAVYAVTLSSPVTVRVGLHGFNL